jgi:Zn-dependent protease with chaperone function
LFVLWTAASAFVAFSTSAVLGVGLAAFRQRLAGLTAAAEARVLFGVSLLPMLACVAVMSAALAPSFGWIVDHCSQAVDVHAHPHICMAHHVSELPARTLVVLAAVLLVRLSFSGAHLLRGVIAALVTGRALARVSSQRREIGVRVLPFDEPQAFVVGTFSPAVFVTRGLLAEAHREHLAPVLSHERAHVRRRDPLRRLVACLALGFHLPGLAAWLERRLARAHEMAADADAAGEMHSRERVATALVRLARAQKHVLRTVLAFGDSDVELRVATLLDCRRRYDQPGKAVLIVGVAMLFVLVAVSAGSVHHGVEIVLGLLGG